jgi:hypothetical protein
MKAGVIYLPEKQDDPPFLRGRLTSFDHIPVGTTFVDVSFFSGLETVLTKHSERRAVRFQEDGTPKIYNMIENCFVFISEDTYDEIKTQEKNNG